MTDPDDRIADFIAMSTLCRRMAMELEAENPERFALVIAHASAEAEHALTVQVSLDRQESCLLRNAAKSQLTFIKAIRRWVRPFRDAEARADEPSFVKVA